MNQIKYKKLTTPLFLILSSIGITSGYAGGGPVAVLQFSNAYVVAPMTGTNITAGYALVKNSSDVAVVLKIQSAVPFKAAELHETVETQGRMGMNQVEQVSIAAHQSFEFKPGAHHIMLFDATRALKVGEMITLRFKANDIPLGVSFAVKARSGTEGTHHHQQHH